MYASPRQMPYAPTPYSYTPDPSLAATINLDEEVKLTPKERDLYEGLAEVYSIIITLDGLEKAYIKDSISESEYTEICGRLLKQYQSNLRDEAINKEFGDLDSFQREWDMDCPRATERLRIGLPATLSDPHPHQSTHPSLQPPNPHSNSHSHPHSPSSTTTTTTLSPHPHPPPSTQQPTPTSILLATENFITFLDALKLGLLSKDQLHPLLSEVIQSVTAVTGDFDGRGKIVSWLIRLNGMRAQEELGAGEARELMFEMEGAYAGFKAVLG